MVALAALATLSCAPAGGRSAQSRAPVARPASATGASAAQDLVTLEVGGMMCQGCVARVKQSLEKVPGVSRVDVSLDHQRAVVLADTSVRDTALTGAVRRAGSEFLGIVVAR